MNETTITLLDVQARWAYSEITDSHFTGCYDNFADVDLLRAKRRDGVAFSSLSWTERYHLATMCFGVRLGLMNFFIGVERYHVRQLTKAELAQLLVPPNVWGNPRPALIPFDQYLTIPIDAPGDARNVSENPSGYQAPTDPLSIGRYCEYPVLLDGYHRAVSFWKFAPSESVVSAYFPVAS